MNLEHLKEKLSTHLWDYGLRSLGYRCVKELEGAHVTNHSFKVPVTVLDHSESDNIASWSRWYRELVCACLKSEDTAILINQEVPSVTYSDYAELTNELLKMRHLVEGQVRIALLPRGYTNQLLEDSQLSSIEEFESFSGLPFHVTDTNFGKPSVSDGLACIISTSAIDFWVSDMDIKLEGNMLYISYVTQHRYRSTKGSPRIHIAVPDEISN